MRSILFTCFVVSLALVFPAMHFVSEFLISENVSRPKSDAAYLDKAAKIDETFLDQFNYFLHSRKGLKYVIDRQVVAQQSMAWTVDPDYRIQLAINSLETQYDEKSLWRAACRVLEAIGSKWTMHLEYFVAGYVDDPNRNQLSVLEGILIERERDYGRIIRMLENTTISTNRLEAFWTDYKTSHLPGIDPRCLTPFPNASELQKLFDSSLFFEGECSAKYRNTYWTQSECKTVIAWSYLFSVCIVFASLFGTCAWLENRNKST